MDTEQDNKRARLSAVNINDGLKKRRNTQIIH